MADDLIEAGSNRVALRLRRMGRLPAPHSGNRPPRPITVRGRRLGGIGLSHLGQAAEVAYDRFATGERS